MSEREKLSRITRRIIGTALEMYIILGADLLESACRRLDGLGRLVTDFPASLRFSATSAVRDVV